MEDQKVAVATEIEVKQQLSFAARLAIAYEHYRFVTQNQIKLFNLRLREQTMKRYASAIEGSLHGGNNLYSKYDVLDFSPWADYPGDPGLAVKEAAATAIARDIFDVLEVAKVKSQVEYKDPILFGRVLGCGDRFFIAQWDNDVTIDDLIGPNEG